MVRSMIVNVYSLARDGTGIALYQAFNDINVFTAASLGDAFEGVHA
jgi:hypothetical protein